MKSRLEKLNDAYNYLRFAGIIETQKEFASAIKMHETSVSSAFNGDERYLSDNIFKKICETYPNTFNLHFFTKNEGEMLNQSVNSSFNSNKNNGTLSGSNVIGNINLNDIKEVLEIAANFQELLKTKDRQIDKLYEWIDGLIKNKN